MHGRMLAATVGALLALPATAQAAWELTADGQPLISNRFGEAAQVFVCPPGGAPCVEAGWNARSDFAPAYAPGETPAGTTFEVRAAAGTDRSPAWQGQVMPVTPPRVRGSLVARGWAAWTPATWRGGWGDTTSTMRMFACRTVEATGCHLLPELAYCGPACDTIARRDLPGYALPDALVGHYVFVSEDPVGSDSRGRPVTATAPPKPWNADHPWNLALGPRTQLSAPAGPLRPAFSVSLRERAYRSAGTARLGRLRCRVPCDVDVSVFRGGRRLHHASFAARGSRAITAPYRRGRLTVRVRIDGEVAAAGRVRAR